MRVVSIALLLFLVAIEPNAQTRNIDIETIGERVFIGQAYPSGNVYLKPFSGNSAERSFWPHEMIVIGATGTRPGLPAARRAAFERVLASRVENDTVKSVYIPAIEGMADDYDPCRSGVTKPRNPAHQTISEDFFGSVVDHCEPNDGVGLYRTLPSNYSVLSIGIPNVLSLVSHRIIPDKPLRPLTPAEQQEIDRRKAETQKIGAEFECSTTPKYLDAAVQIFEGSIKEGNLTLRVSFYETPGCAGHLAAVYILDVLRDGQLLKKFELSQSRGLL